MTHFLFAKLLILNLARKQATVGAKECTFRITGLHLLEEPWILLNRVAFERAGTIGWQASLFGLQSQLVEYQKSQLEKELASASR